MRIVVLDGHTLNPGDNPWDAVAALGELVVHDRTPDGYPFDLEQLDMKVKQGEVQRRISYLKGQ